MTFPRYSQYQDTGVGWLGKVPSHWTTKKISRSFGSIKSGTTPPSSESYWYEGGEIPWITTGELRESLIESTNKCVTSDALEQFTALTIHPKGSLAIAMYGATIGRLGILGIEATTNQACCVISKPIDMEIRFLFYWLQGFKRTIIDIYATGGGQPNINQEIIADMRVPHPDLNEQNQIIQFLNNETAKIDALIAEQEKLIELLKEKRQAVISHSVTKGLDPNVKMKDSGVEWLGKVPARWRVKYLRHIAKIVRGASPRPAGDPTFFNVENENGSNTPWVTVAEITKDENLYLNSVNEYLTPEGVLASQFFDAGTVIFSNSGATLGVPKILGTNCCANDGVLAFKKLSDEINSEFLYFFLLTTTERLRTEMKQGGGQPNLNTDIVKNIGFAAPPLDEQITIVTLLKQEERKFSSLINEANSAIDLLRERRLASICAAVTGQIDVRYGVNTMEAA